MKERKNGVFLTSILVVVNVLTLIFVIGRSHFVLGTALILSRWILLLLGLLVFIWAKPILGTATV